MELKSHIKLVEDFMQKMDQIPVQEFKLEDLSEEELSAAILRLTLLVEYVDAMFQAFLSDTKYHLSAISPLFKTISSYIQHLSSEDFDIDRVALLKAIVDQEYVNLGTSVLFNLPVEEAFTAIHENNLTKIDTITGKLVKRTDGKILASLSYTPLDIDNLLQEYDNKVQSNVT